jgi:hypothetical protein
MAFLGQQYQLPQQSYGQPQSAAMSGPQSKQAAYNEGLLGLEEDVKGYYKDYSALNQFAHGMWQNYQIDVTAPDPMNPASVDAYNMYLQGLAQVQERGNRMRNRQEMFKTGYQESLRNPEVRFAKGVEAETFDPTKDISNVGATTATKMIAQRFGRPVKSEEELAELKQGQADAIRDLEAELATVAGDPAREREVQSQIDLVKAMKPSYDPTFDKQLELQERVAWIRKNQPTDKSYVSTRYQEIANARGGNVDFFHSMRDGKGNKVFDDVVYSPAKGQIMLRPAGSATPQVIDLKGPDGGAKELHMLLNQYASTKDEEVDWNEVVGWGTKYKSELGDKSIITPIPEYDKSGLNVAKTALRSPKNPLHTPLVEGLNAVANREGLIMPDLRGLFGLKIVDLSHDDGFFWDSFDVKYLDSEGEEQTMQLDVKKKKDMDFLDEILQTNSGAVDFTRFSQQPQTETVKMFAPDGTPMNVPAGDVEAALGAGYTK